MLTQIVGNKTQSEQYSPNLVDEIEVEDVDESRTKSKVTFEEGQTEIADVTVKSSVIQQSSESEIGGDDKLEVQKSAVELRDTVKVFTGDDDLNKAPPC